MDEQQNEPAIEDDTIEDLDVEATDADNVKGGAASNAGADAVESRTGFTSNHNDTLLRS
jgi:hypothetical protein